MPNLKERTDDLTPDALLSLAFAALGRAKLEARLTYSVADLALDRQLEDLKSGIASAAALLEHRDRSAAA